jgi:colicin import membrane protein
VLSASTGLGENRKNDWHTLQARPHIPAMAPLKCSTQEAAPTPPAAPPPPAPPPPPPPPPPRAAN